MLYIIHLLGHFYLTLCKSNINADQDINLQQYNVEN